MMEEFLQDIKALGGLPFYAIIILLFVVLADYKIAFTLFIALIAAYGIIILIRSIYFKERPKKVEYKNRLQKLDASSFPSLHTIRAVILGIILATTISSPLFSMLVIPCVILAAYARVKLQRHHLIDVFAGVVLGILIALGAIWVSNIVF